ncbi:MAG TPA: 2-amino-4-hydroxy-6-hydroxymethyldihydropteridine diphosphokinase [Fimbriimonadaceae bacterium]|nr:2-amino-4-hydroxy-6-hydroxymethyldihydropteridine diphosphokinase [Fimbriimonadaceae bacterium]HRJ32537.1 2-amino-4-hydroxy-6-hydroxymethyldihydropteridine diphosphokinase [Fimbriimonadaceae bacterium]
MPKCFFGLGSNQGDSQAILIQALEEMSRYVRLTRCSFFYETQPLYITQQPFFLNLVIEGFSEDSPVALVQKCKELEQQLGRIPRQRNGPRELDIDLLLHGEWQYSFNHSLGQLHAVQVPHPRISERRFVLDPLADLDPSLWIPGQGTVNDLLAQPDIQAQAIRRLTHAPISF